MEKTTSEILNITLEECAEVTQAISKIFRFGWDGFNPNTPSISNKSHLEEEIGDLMCMVEILQEHDIINAQVVKAAALQKRAKLMKWSNIFSTKE